MLKSKFFKSRKPKKEADGSSLDSGASREGDGLSTPRGYTIVKPEKELSTKLHRAVWNGKNDKVLQLLEETTGKSGKPKHDVNAVDKYGRTAMHLAAVKGNLFVIDYLREHNAVASCRMQDSDGNTPLHKVIECGRYAPALKILGMMDNVDIKNSEGQTPLHLAAINNDVAIANKLLDKGAYVDEYDNKEYTPLALACYHGNKDFAELMVKEDCNVNYPNIRGRTPLMLASCDDRHEIVKCLISAPFIDPKLRDYEGKSVHDYYPPDSRVAKLLKKYREEDPPEVKSHYAPMGYPQGNISAEISLTTVTSMATTNSGQDNVISPRSFLTSDSDSLGYNDSDKNELKLDDAMRERLRRTFLADTDEDDLSIEEIDLEDAPPVIERRNEATTFRLNVEQDIPRLPIISESPLLSSDEDEGEILPIDDVPSAPVDDKRSSPIDDKRSSPIDDKRSSPIDNKRSSPIDDKRSSPIDDKRSSPIDNKRSSPIDDKRSSPINDKRSSPVDDKRSSPIDDKRFVPVDDKRSSPIDDRSSASSSKGAVSNAKDVNIPKRKAIDSDDDDIIAEILNDDSSEVFTSKKPPLPVSAAKVKPKTSSFDEEEEKEEANPDVTMDEADEPIERDWDKWDSTDEEEEEDEQRSEGEVVQKMMPSLLLKDEEEESEEWDSSSDDDFLDDNDLPGFGLSPRVYLPPSVTLPSPVTAGSPVTSRPVTAGVRIASLPASPVTSVPIATGSPVTSVPIATGSPVTSVPLATGSPVTSLPLATGSPVTSLPIATGSPVTSLLPIATGSPVTSSSVTTGSSVPSTSQVSKSPKFVASKPSTGITVEIPSLTSSPIKATTVPSAAMGVAIQSPTGIPPAEVMERTLQSQDSRIISDHASSSPSPSKIAPQTSADLRVTLYDEEDSEDEEENEELDETIQNELLKGLRTPLKKDSAVPMLQSDPVVIATASVDPSFHSLIADRKKENSEQQNALYESEASRRKKEKDNEFLSVLKQRKKTIDGDTSLSPVKETVSSATNGVAPATSSQKIQSMKQKWEDGLLNVSSTDSLSSSEPDELPPVSPSSPLPAGATGTLEQTQQSDDNLLDFSVSKERMIPVDKTPEQPVKGKDVPNSPHKSFVSSSSPAYSDVSNSPSQRQADLQKKYEQTQQAKLQLEKEKLDKELESRTLQYQLDQMKGDLQTALDDKKKLEEQLDRAVNQLKDKFEETESKTLNLKELEVENRTLRKECQQFEEELLTLTNELEAERNQYSLKNSSFQEQKRLYTELHEEATRAIEQRGQLSGLLEATKTSLEEEIADLKETNASLKAELQEKKEIQHQLENEVDELKEEVTEYRAKDKTMTADLSELQSKAEILTIALDRETGIRQKLDDQVTSVNSQLSLANSELSQLRLEGTKQDRMSIQQNQELLREKALLEKDLSASKEEKQRLAMQLENTQGKLIAVEQELKSTVGVVNDKSNQLSVMQRQLDQQQHNQVTSQDVLRREREQVTHLEAQLATVNEKLSRALAEQQRTELKVESTEKKALEMEFASKEEKIKQDVLIASLQSDLKKANDEIHDQREQLLLLREQLATNEASRMAMENEIPQLQQEVIARDENISELQYKLKTADAAFNEVDIKKESLEEAVSSLRADLCSQEQKLAESKAMIDQFKDALEKAHSSIKLTAEERDKAILEKAELDTKFAQVDGKANLFLCELGVSAEREKQLKTEIEQLNQSRATLQELATKLRSEVVSAEHSLDTEKSYRLKAEQENAELKELWENEVKAKHKITEKFLLLEQEYKESGDQFDSEKQKMLKVFEQKGMAEMKLEALHERNGQLQRENGELKGNLKSLKKRVKRADKVEATARNLQQELDQTHASLQGEITLLQKQVDLYRDQLKKEADGRQSVEHRATQLKLELSSLQKSHSDVLQDLHEKEKSLHKSERVIRKMKDDYSQIQNTMHTEMVPKSELDVLSRQLEEKSREEFSKRMAEVNDLLEQQSLNYQKQDSIRVMQENERREKQNIEITDLKQKLNTLLVHFEEQRSQVESATSEARRFKSLYEQETVKRDKLTAKLARSKERATASRLQLNYEKKQTKMLRDTSCNVLSQLTSNGGVTTSTPIKAGDRPHSPPNEELLQSIHSELDRSLARHMDSASLKGFRQPVYDSSKAESHLDSIRRNYRV